MERRLATILAADVVGYSRLMEADEEATARTLASCREVAESLVSGRNGRMFGSAGDSFIAEFSSPVQAVRCAVEIQRELETRAIEMPEDRRMRLRIGINLGDVIVEDDNLLGDGVNIAARLQSIAEPGKIAISKQVYDQIDAKIPVEFISLGEQTVKNISRPIEVYSADLSFDVTSTDVIRFDDFELDTVLFELRRSGERIYVEPQIFDLLVFLARNHHRTVTKDEIYSSVWGNRNISESTLSSRIRVARQVLGDNGTSQKMISTVRGRGFRFVAPIKSRARVSTGEKNETTRGNNVLNDLNQRPSVAVLPFTNVSHNSDEDYLADGISEDITTALSKNRWLLVIARNPAFAFRNSNDSIRTIGEKLNADYLVTGTVRKAKRRIRIGVQVVDAGTELSVWSERFDRDMVDVFDLQDEISEMIASRIEAELGLSEQRKAEKKSRKNLGAWDLYQLGTSQFYKFTPDSNLEAQKLLRKSIKLDPEFSGAYSRLAYAIVLSMVYFDNPPDGELLDEALEIARRAIELDDQDANAYFTIGRVYLARREYNLAIESLQDALNLNPALAVVHCGLGDSLAYEGRLDEAIEQFEIAVKLSPHDPFRWAFYSYRSLAHLFRGEFYEAVHWARTAARVPNAQFWAKAHLVAALGHVGDQSQAKSAVKDLLAVKPNFSTDFAKEHLFYIRRSDQLEIYIDGLRKAGLK